MNQCTAPVRGHLHGSKEQRECPIHGTQHSSPTPFPVAALPALVNPDAILAALVQDPDASDEALAAGIRASTYSPDAVRAIEHPRAGRRVKAVALAAVDGDIVSAAIERFGWDVETVEAIATQVVWIRIRALSVGDPPVELLERLADDDVVEVQQEVVRHANTPPSVIAKMVARAAERAVEAGKRAKWPYWVSAAVVRDDLTPDTLAHLSRCDLESVKIAVARHANTPVAALIDMWSLVMTDKVLHQPGLPPALMGNRSLPSQMLAEAAEMDTESPFDAQRQAYREFARDYAIDNLRERFVAVGVEAHNDGAFYALRPYWGQVDSLSADSPEVRLALAVSRN